MNSYYGKLEIGKDKVSNHLAEVKKKLAGWSAEERQAARISLQEDIKDSENVNQIFPMLSIVLNAFTTATIGFKLESLEEGTVVGIVFCLSILVFVLGVFMWMGEKRFIYKYEGLLSLLEDMEQEAMQKQP